MAQQGIDTFKIPSSDPSEREGDVMRPQLDAIHARTVEQVREARTHAKDYLAYAATKPPLSLEGLDPVERQLRERFRVFDAARQRQAGATIASSNEYLRRQNTATDQDSEVVAH